jgi:hypothetical protein
LVTQDPQQIFGTVAVFGIPDSGGYVKFIPKYIKVGEIKFLTVSHFVNTFFNTEDIYINIFLGVLYIMRM